MTEHEFLALLVVLETLVTLAVWVQTVRFWRNSEETLALNRTTLDAAIELLRRTKS